MNLTQGYFNLVLHAHLPFVRHPEHEFFLEESWLFEGITETYIPLLLMFRAWERDGIPFKLTLSLTPTLLAMLNDELLQNRYLRYLRNLKSLSEKELDRIRSDSAFYPAAKLYYDRFVESENFFENECQRNLIPAFKHFQDLGFLEIITSAATHAFLPLLSLFPEAVKAQIRIAATDYEHYFNCKPRGIWLPECGYFSNLDEILAENGIEYFFLDAHGLLYGEPRPLFGVHAPIRTPAGVHAFSRDLETSKVVWSQEEGYPGDPYYREFYRDIGWELDYEYLKPHLGTDLTRKNLGIKYFRVTDRHASFKMPYEPEIAMLRADAHASHFLSQRIAQAQSLYREMGRAPILVSTYDAELFGHWWFEGPKFLDFLFRKMYFDQSVVAMTHPLEYLNRHDMHQTLTPCISSWGDQGYNQFWLNEKNDWIYRHLHAAVKRMLEQVHEFHEATPIIKPQALLERRVLNQAARELLLAQSSDWAFIMRTGTMVPYAEKRTRDHLARFHYLCDMLKTKLINEPWLQELEWRDNIFPDLDYRVYL